MNDQDVKIKQYQNRIIIFSQYHLEKILHRLGQTSRLIWTGYINKQNIIMPYIDVSISFLVFLNLSIYLAASLNYNLLDIDIINLTKNARQSKHAAYDAPSKQLMHISYSKSLSTYYLMHCISPQIDITKLQCDIEISLYSVPRTYTSKKFYWGRINNNLDYLIFIFDKSICVQRYSIIVSSEKRPYELCNDIQKFVNYKSINQYTLFLYEEANYLKLYAVINDNTTSLAQFTIYPNSSIVLTKALKLRYPNQYYYYLPVISFQSLICIYGYHSKTQDNDILQCYDFIDESQPKAISINFSNRQQYLFSYGQNLLYLDQQRQIGGPNFFILDINFEESSPKLKQLKIEEYNNFGYIHNIVMNDEQTWVFLQQKDHTLFLTGVKLYQGNIMPYQRIRFDFLFGPQVIQQDHQNIIFFNTKTSSFYLFKYIQIGQINPLVYLIIFTTILAVITIPLAIYFVLKFKIQMRFYLNRIKNLIILEIVTLLLLYSIFTLIALRINENQTINFNKSNQTVEIGSFYSRFLYFIFISIGLTNCLFILFTQRNISNEFSHLLSKHQFSLKGLIFIKLFWSLLKNLFFSFLNILYIYLIQKISQNYLIKLFPQPFQKLQYDSIGTLICGFILLTSLSSILYIIQVSFQSISQQILIFFVWTFAMSFLNQYFFKTAQVQRTEKIFMFLSPFTIFSTILEWLFISKTKFAKFINEMGKSNISINIFFIISIVQMILLIILAFIKMLQRVKKNELKEMFKKESDNSQSILTSSKLSSFLLQKSKQNQNNLDSPLLNVFIPYKLSSSRGLYKKKLLQNISFKGYQNQIISIIDFQNQSKSVLLKILLNDQKSDSSLQDLKAQIFYSKQVKLSFCSDKNICCDELNAIQHLQLFLMLKNRGLSEEQKKKQIRFMLDEFNITDQDSIKQARLLSGGTKKKMCLCCAFIGKPQVLILNDPTMGLDSRFKRIFWQILKNYKQGRLIIVGTSDSEQAEMISDKIWIINNGKMTDYLKYRSQKYVDVSFEFSTKQNYEYCKNWMRKQFDSSDCFLYENGRNGNYRLELQLYDIRNQKKMNKITELIKILDKKINKDYYFYYKTCQTKFTAEQFFKYKTISQGLHVQESQLHSNISQIMFQQLVEYKQIQDQQLQENQNYNEKQAKKLLMDLWQKQKKSKINLDQIKGIIYFKIYDVKNEGLIVKQILIISLFFWIASIIYQQYGYLNMESYVVVGYRSNFILRIINVYCFLFFSLIFNTNANSYNKQLLVSIGMNFRNICLGQSIFNISYIFITYFINFTIYLIYLNLQNEQTNFLILYFATLSYIINYTLWTLCLLIIIKNKEIIILIELIFMVLPVYVYEDIYMKTFRNQSQLITEVFSYILFPSTFLKIIQNQSAGTFYLNYMVIILCQILAPIIIIFVVEKIRFCWKPQTLKIGQIDNIVNDDIVQLQGLTQDLKNDKSAVVGHNICKKYKNQGRTSSSIQNMYFTCLKGEILTFVGHNGCGKTTLFNIIANKTFKSLGQLSVFGVRQEQMRSKDKLQFGYCTQDGDLFTNFTIQQNIRFIGQVKGLQQKYLTKFIIKMLEYFKLNDKQKTLIKELSEGQRKKISIIICFLSFPSFILLDQPTSSIDSQSKSKIMSLLKVYCQMFQTVVMVTTHNINEAQQYSNKVCILKKGHLLKVGKPHELVKDPSQQLYRLIVIFRLQEDNNVLIRSKKIVINFIRQFEFIDVAREQGLKFIYGLDMFKVDMHRILVKMMQLFEEKLIDKFDLYKYNLQQVVRYNMVTDDFRERNKQKLKMREQ